MKKVLSVIALAIFATTTAPAAGIADTAAGAGSVNTPGPRSSGCQGCGNFHGPWQVYFVRAHR